MDFKKFYLSPEGRVNRKQFWLWLVLPLTVIEIVLVLVDVATENYNPELGIGLLSGIFALVALIRISLKTVHGVEPSSNRPQHRDDNRDPPPRFTT